MAPAPSASQWLRGVVKEVPSGDTVVVMAGSASPDPLQPPPAERRLTLSSLVAPRMGRRDTRDEPYAWQSREFLRKLAIGQPCVFRVDYVLEQAATRPAFGTVFVNDGKENLGLAVVSAGWAKVRTGGGQQSPHYAELEKAQAAAEARGLGLWAADRDAVAEAVRPVGEADGQGLLASVGKGKQVQAVVDGVVSGSMLRVTLLPSLQQAAVLLAGVQCPSMGRRPAAAAEGEEAPAEAPQPEPFAREAAQLAAFRFLNRDVRLTLWGVSQFGMLVASVQGGEQDLGDQLLKAGLGKVAEWSLNMMVTGGMRLREAERAAKQARIGAWVNYVPAAGASAKLSDTFEGTVAEVVSGDCLVVRDKASSAERRVNLSSVRAPRVGTRDRAPEPWALEAKEFLRQRLIGKQVEVKLEYTRKVAPQGPEGALVRGGEERLMTFGAVTLPDASGAADKVANVAELLLARGLAQVVKHRGDEERAGAYEALLVAEEQAKQGKKGVFSSKEPALPRLNDLSAPGSGARAKQHLSFLQRAGKMTAVCEHVMSGHRVKLYVPSQGVTIAFSPSSVRCPARAQAAGGAGSGRAEAEPFADEAFAFTRSRVLQHDCEVGVDSVDKAGTFLGTLRIGRLNLGVALLEEGLAKLHPSFDPTRTPGGRELVTAQDKARRARLRVWEKDDGSTAEAAADAVGGDQNAVPAERVRVQVVVTEMRDSNAFYVQMAEEPRLAWLAEQLAGLGLEDVPVGGLPRLGPGDRCIARFSADGQFYRALVERAHTADPTAPQYDVLFEDFGNRERVKSKDLRSCPPSLAAVPPQAHLAQLAFVKAPQLDAEYGLEAAQLLSDLLGDGKCIAAFVEQRERQAPPAGAKWGATAPPKLHLTMLGTDGSIEEGPNAQLLAAGLARFVPQPIAQGAEEVVAALRDAEEVARKRRRGIWQYGDIDESDEEV